MATPIVGNKIGVYVDVDAADSGTEPRLVALATSASLSFSNSTIETATKKVTTDGATAGQLLDSGLSTTHAVAGTSSFSVSCEGLLDLSDPQATADATDDATAKTEHGFQNLMDLALRRKEVTLFFVDATNATAAGGPGYKGNAFIESIEASGGVDDFATYSVTFKGTGDLTLV